MYSGEKRMSAFEKQFNANAGPIEQERFISSWEQYGPGILGHEQKFILSTGAYVRTLDCYDFNKRLLTSSNVNSDTIAVTPFSQLDPEVLAAIHTKLVDMGGTPPELPAAPGTLAVSRKSSLTL